MKKKAAEAGDDIRGVRWSRERDGVSQRVVRFADENVLGLTARAPFRGIGSFSLRKGDGAEFS